MSAIVAKRPVEHLGAIRLFGDEESDGHET
jgi:hypothetical protein